MHPTRMKMKLPLQRKNETVENVTNSRQRIAIQNDKVESQFAISSIDVDDGGCKRLLFIASTVHAEEEVQSFNSGTSNHPIVMDSPEGDNLSATEN